MTHNYLVSYVIENYPHPAAREVGHIEILLDSPWRSGTVTNFQHTMAERKMGPISSDQVIVTSVFYYGTSEA